MSDHDTDEGVTIGANTPELSVSELSQALKRTVEDRFSRVKLRGEISNYRGPHSSGHAYFSLKDENARIDAVIWKGAMLKMRMRPQEGLEVLATGRITTFPGKSSYQIVIEALEPAGVGALMALLEARRIQLAAEGLFDPSRKKPLHFLPKIIGVITSPTGAVIRDIIHRISDRFPRRIILWPVRVQGETSSIEITQAINGFNALPDTGDIPRPDVIIVARGGGSLEDLWAFNEENVVRAAAQSAIPLISAIGHETDTTLIDFVADLRAPTPTAAAEKSVPVRADLSSGVFNLMLRFQAAHKRLQDRKQQDLLRLARLLPNSDHLLSTPRQRLDRSSDRLESFSRNHGNSQRLKLARLASILARHSPQVELARTREKVSSYQRRLHQAMQAYMTLVRQKNQGSRQKLITSQTRLNRAIELLFEKNKEKLLRLSHLQKSLSHHAVLSRGFALIRDKGGDFVTSVTQVTATSHLIIEVSDGLIHANVCDDATQHSKRIERKEKLRRGQRKKTTNDQGSLL